LYVAAANYLGFLFGILQMMSFNFAKARINYSALESAPNIGQLNGNLEQPVANKENGNNALTITHVLHPIAEFYDMLSLGGSVNDA
jgi:hypothetical protein